MASPISTPPASAAPDRPARIDRRDLAKDRHVWRIYALVFAIVGISSIGIPLIWPEQFDRTRLWIFAAGLLTISAIAASTRPPRLGSKRNHLLIASIPVMSALGMVAYEPGSVAPAAAAIFSGTYSAARLLKRRHLVAHCLFGAAVLFLPVVALDLGHDTLVAVISIIPGIWVIAWATTLILEAAEAQGQELASLVRRDPLTGVGNRRLLDEALAEQLARHAKDGRQLSVLALDLDGFKALNDQVGHDAGDALLRAVAATLTRVVGANDVVVRQGGDEFCILLPETGPAEAQAVRETIDYALAGMSRTSAGVSTGVGIATFPVDATTATDLLELADARLGDDKSVHRATPRPIPTDIVMPAMPVGPPVAPGTGSMRVSRRQLAVNLTVWRAQGILVGFFSLAVGLMALFTLEGADPQRTAFAFCLVLSVVTYFTLRREPPAIGTFLNHAVVALPYVAGTLLMVAVPDIATAAIGPLALSGALAGIRLVDRRQIVAHLAAATVCVAGLIASGLVGVPTILALMLVGLVVWGTGMGVMVYLETSEAQSDELERLVRRDPLTGVGNRRLLAEQLEEEVQRSVRTGRPLTVLTLDLNGFKALNDSVGHAAGDDLLRDVAEGLLAVARDGDTVVRQGGDEFCVLLPETDGLQAVPIANAARAAVARLSRDGHRITTGVGIATFPTEAGSGDVLLYVADERLREDKDHGTPRERRADARPEFTPPAVLELVQDPPDAANG